MVNVYAHLAVVDRENVPSLASAIGLTDSKIPPANPRPFYAVVQAIGDSIRFTTDGVTDPVAGTTGHRLVEDGVIELWGESMTKFLAIDDGGTAKLEVSYYGRGS